MVRAASTGQEAYSLAMSLRECQPQLAGREIEILATDIARPQLARARRGLFTQFEVQRGLPVELLVRHFRRQGAHWRIAEELRGAVSFREWNLLDDLQPLGRFDMVFCRNVLIYFDQPTRARVLEAVARQMAPDGSLYLGAAETVLGITDRFASVAGERGIYRLSDSAACGAGQRVAAAAG